MSMRDIASDNFGLMIAYVLPGFTVLWELQLISPTVYAWLTAPATEAPTVAGFLYATIGSVGIGLTISTLRWLVIDTIHHHTGIQRPNWDFSQLAAKLPAFETMIEIHYRYFQFASGMFLAILIAATIRWSVGGFRFGEAILIFGVEVLFFIASRDSLAKYYERVAGILANH